MLLFTGSIKSIIILTHLIFSKPNLTTGKCDHLTNPSDILTGLGTPSIPLTHQDSTMSAVTTDDLARISKEHMDLIIQLRAEDKKERALERADEKKERATERAEYIGTLSQMIDKTMDGKLENALKPVVERQDALERETKEAISDMSAKLSAFEAQLSARPQQSRQSYAAAAAAATLPLPGDGQASPSTPATIRHSPHIAASLEDMIGAAKLTLGFEPIDKRDLARNARLSNISDKQDIMKHAIVDFLRGEMNIKTVSVTDIVKVFPQPGIPEDQCKRLYAQFSAQYILSTVYNHVSKLRTREHRVVLYAPHTHQEQLRYLGDLANSYRNPTDPSTERVKTRIKYGFRDLYLQVKSLGSTHWTTVATPNLPPIQPSSQATPAVSMSPGRGTSTPTRGQHPPLL